MSQVSPPILDEGGLTRSEILPFRSTKVSMWRSPALPPLALTVIAFFYFSLSPFNSRGDIDHFLQVLGTFLAVIVFFEIYDFSGIQKNLLSYLPAALIVAATLVFFGAPWFYIYHGLLGGEPDRLTTSSSALDIIYVYFVGPGCMEETIKAVPALLGLVITWSATRHPERTPGRFSRVMGLRGPLDGVLMGAAAGIGFLLVETLLQYVPGEINKHLSGGDNLGTAALFGVSTLIPRILNVVLGHSAWAALSGYFIGMAVRHPEARLRLIVPAILFAAVLHGGWDSSIALRSPLFMVVFGVISALAFLACLVKARQLDQADRGLFHPLTGAVPTVPTAAPTRVAAAPSSIPPAATHALTGVASWMERLVGVHAKAQATPPVLPPASPATTVERAGVAEPTASPAPLVAPVPPATPVPPAVPAPATVPAVAIVPAAPTPPRSDVFANDAPGTLRILALVDGSGSMAGERMAAVNYAMRALIPMLRRAAADHPGVPVTLTGIRFADAASWVGSGPAALAAVEWTDVTAGGASCLGTALDLLAASLAGAPGAANGPPALLMLFSDGLPTDDTGAGFTALLGTAAGARATRVGVAVGAEADRDFMTLFAGRMDQRPLTPETLSEVVRRIVWGMPEAPAQQPAVAAAPAPAGAPPPGLSTATPDAGQKPAEGMVW